MKILILKPSSLGDVVQALPVLRLLRKHFPGCEVHWFLERSLLPLLDGDPDLAFVVPFERQRWRFPHQWGGLGAAILSLRAERFDIVIDLQSLGRTGAIAWLANGAFTIGLDDSREGARGFYDVAVPRRSSDTHAVDWYLDVLRALKVPVQDDFNWLPRRERAAEAVQKKWQPGRARWIALQAGARWENKRWPATHFAELTRRLASEFPDARFAILGGGADRELGRVIAEAAPERCVDLTGATTLPEMIEWIRLCDLMVTNDTGPMHVAAALRKPVIAMLGPTNPRRTGPYGQLHRVTQLALPCVPCMKSECRYEKPLECMRAIGPEMIFQRVREVLA